LTETQFHKQTISETTSKSLKAYASTDSVELYANNDCMARSFFNDILLTATASNRWKELGK
jgi:hypothetical protein